MNEISIGLPREITIVGEGPCGLTIANFATMKGYQVTLIKKRQKYTRDQIVFLNDVSLKVLEKIGVLCQLNISQFILEGKARGLIKTLELETALMNQLKSTNANIIEAEFKGIQEKHLILKTNENDLIIPYKILIGTDGANSPVRKALDIRCDLIGKHTLVASVFLTESLVTFSVIEKTTPHYFIRNVSTPIGKLIILHNKVTNSNQRADRQALIDACSEQGWIDEAQKIPTSIETPCQNIRARLEKADTFVCFEMKALIAGDAVANGSFYLGRGVNLAIQNADICSSFLDLEPTVEAFDWYNNQVQKLADDLVTGNQHLFE